MTSLERTTRSRTGSAGFTLIELITVIVVAGLLLTALTSFYLSEQRALRQQQIQIETSQSLRVALEQMVRDLRAAGRNPLDAANIGFVKASATEVEFTLDNDNDGLVTDTDPAEHKGFKIESNQLKTYVANAGGLTKYLPLADDVSVADSTLSYYRGDGTPITSLPASAADLEAIRRVDIALTVTNNVPGAPAISRTEVASVRVRNRP